MAAVKTCQDTFLCCVFWDQLLRDGFFPEALKEITSEISILGAWRWGKFSLYYQYHFSIDKTVLIFLFLIDLVVYSRICFSFILKKNIAQNISFRLRFFYFERSGQVDQEKDLSTTFHRDRGHWLKYV